MNFLSVEQLTKSFGDLELFRDITFGLSKGDKVALVARNGTGKSTLLRILGGRSEADSGSFSFRKDIRVACLEQEPVLDSSLTVEQMIANSNTEVQAARQLYESILEKSATESDPALDRQLEQAGVEMDRLHAWDYERRLKLLLDLFRIKQMDQVIGSLSGGERKRLALALVLLDEPDFLILDEPTNHLDLPMIEWLEEYLGRSTLTLLMVTHDRYFLERVCTGILEMDHQQLFSYQGSYADFLEKRELREGNRQLGIAKAGQLMKKELEWIRRMPKARTGKSKSRIDAFHELKQRARKDADPGDLVLRVNTPRMGGKIMELEDISKAYGDQTILNPFTYLFNKGDRIGIVGPNGSGKTTLLNLLTANEKPDSGTVITGQTMVLSYYRQMHPDWDPSMRVIDVVREIAEVVRLEDGRTVSASKFLEFFLFPPETQYKHIELLSGGERRRLHLLTVLIKNPNFLVLDEPTNDLDLFALARLEEFLLAYKGVLLIVSHDRFFLDKLCDHLFILEGEGKLRDFYGPYASYRQEQEARRAVKSSQAEESLVKQTIKKEKGKAPKTKLSYKEKQEYEKLEPRIESLEKEKAELETRLASGEAAYEELEKLGSKLNELIEQIEQLTERWMELEQFT